MTEPVIDPLESIQVDQQQCDLLVVTYPLSDSLTQAIAEQPAVGQTSQLVVTRKSERCHLVLLKPCELPRETRVNFLKLSDDDPGCVHFSLTLGKRSSQLWKLREPTRRSAGLGVVPGFRSPERDGVYALLA
jgi:hypothetical protein